MADDILLPEDEETYLEPAEVIERLRREFSYVNVDKEKGRECVLEGISRLEDLTSEGEGPAGIDLQLEYLREGVDDSYYVRVADDPTSKYAFLATSLVPNQPLVFGYGVEHWRERQDASRGLLEKMAEVLGYWIYE